MDRVADDPSVYGSYIGLTIMGYIFFVLSLVGTIWVYLLSITRLRPSLMETKRKVPFVYWTLNICSWTIIISLIMFIYFFTVWYVMNEDAKKYAVPPTSKLSGILARYMRYMSQPIDITEI